MQVDQSCRHICNVYTDLPPFCSEISAEKINISTVLGHDSRKKVKHSCKISHAVTGNRTRVAPVQDQCSNY